MADETYTLPEEPVYHEVVRKLQNTDPVDADEILNPLIQMLLENTDFVRRLAEAIAAQNTADHAAIREETEGKISAAVAAIPTPDVSGQISAHDGDSDAHAALREALTQALGAHAERADNPHGVTAEQVGAAPAEHTHTAAEVGARPATWTPTAADVGAAPASHGTHVSYGTAAPKMDGTAAAGTAGTVARSDHVHPTDTSRAAANHTHSNYVPTTRKVNGKVLSGDVTLAASDVGAATMAQVNTAIETAITAALGASY